MPTRTTSRRPTIHGILTVSVGLKVEKKEEVKKIEVKVGQVGLSGAGPHGTGRAQRDAASVMAPVTAGT